MNDDGTVHSQARYYPYGAERWSSGTLPTEVRFTGQREQASLGLYHMGARFYDAALGRWISADTIVPEPGNPQSFNRFSYVLGNPLRFVDPTGRYTEDEIMKAFEVQTWDGVLPLFQEGGALEGLWGWLEILRRANDSDMARFGASDGMGSGQTSIGALPGNLGFFSRDDAGHILVGNRAHSEFAAEGRGHLYSLLRQQSDGTYAVDYRTGSSWRHHHIHTEIVPPDFEAAASNALDVGYEVATVALAVTLLPPAMVGAVGLEYLAFYKDLGPGLVGGTQIGAYYEGHAGYYDSGHVFDAAGAVPLLGAIPDALSCVFNFFGWRFYVTP